MRWCVELPTRLQVLELHLSWTVKCCLRSSSATPCVTAACWTRAQRPWRSNPEEHTSCSPLVVFKPNFTVMNMIKCLLCQSRWGNVSECSNIFLNGFGILAVPVDFVSEVFLFLTIPSSRQMTVLWREMGKLAKMSMCHVYWLHWALDKTLDTSGLHRLICPPHTVLLTTTYSYSYSSVWPCVGCYKIWLPFLCHRQTEIFQVQRAVPMPQVELRGQQIFPLLERTVPQPLLG